MTHDPKAVLTAKVNLHATMDAQVWAKEFCRIHGGDESLMIGWFANAIMAGFDEASRRTTSEAPASPAAVERLVEEILQFAVPEVVSTDKAIPEWHALGYREALKHVAAFLRKASSGAVREAAQAVGPLLSAEINALPERVRIYIHDLETNCDPSGMVRENVALRENIAALEARLPKPLSCDGLEVRVGQHYERVAWYVARDDGRYLDFNGYWTGEAEYWNTEEAATKAAEDACQRASPAPASPQASTFNLPAKLLEGESHGDTKAHADMFRKMIGAPPQSSEVDAAFPTTVEAVALEESRQAGEREGEAYLEAFLDRCEGFLNTECMASSEKEIGDVIARFVAEERDELGRRRGKCLPTAEDLLSRMKAHKAHGCREASRGRSLFRGE